ncbi:MAG: ribonuclease HII, partial [Gemmatimonadaceae bacterium]|nr:ribonuclease HII [Chitinophagaceae bacterium]
RDDFMVQLHDAHPYYHWKSNKGYGTEEHRAAIEVHGLCPVHRQSFNISPGAGVQISIYEDE